MQALSCSTRHTNWGTLTRWGFLSILEMWYFSCSAALMGNTVRRWNMMQLLNDSRDIPLGSSRASPCRLMYGSLSVCSPLILSSTCSPEKASLSRTWTSWLWQQSSLPWQYSGLAWPSLDLLGSQPSWNLCSPQKLHWFPWLLTWSLGPLQEFSPRLLWPSSCKAFWSSFQNHQAGIEQPWLTQRLSLLLCEPSQPSRSPRNDHVSWLHLVPPSRASKRLPAPHSCATPESWE